MADNLRDKASAGYSKARRNVGDAVAQSKVKADDALRLAREKAERAAETSRKTAKQAAKKTTQTVHENPLAALIGGLAIGAIAAAMLPRSRKEVELVGDVSKKIRDTAANAAKTARDTAKGQLDALGVNADAARDQLRELTNKIGQAASSATSAAADSVKKK